MRTFLLLLSGGLVLAASQILGRLFTSIYPSAVTVATLAFITLWFLIAAGNMWVGVTRAGYSVAEETPIFLLIFGLPALAALLIKWRF